MKKGELDVDTAKVINNGIKTEDIEAAMVSLVEKWTKIAHQQKKSLLIVNKALQRRWVLEDENDQI